MAKVLAKLGLIPAAFDNRATGWREVVRFGLLVEGNGWTARPSRGADRSR